MSKIKLMIIFKPHAYLQSMVKTNYVKFQKNRNKKEFCKQGTYHYRGTEGRKCGRTEEQRTERRMGGHPKTVPSLFFEKAGDKKKIYNIACNSCKHGEVI